MAAFLLLLHLVALFLTLISLLQPCEENCLEAKCTSRHASSHASESVLQPHYHDSKIKSELSPSYHRSREKLIFAKK